MVSQDKSVAAMIISGRQEERMLPLRGLRNELGAGDDRHLRDSLRMDGRVQLARDRDRAGGREPAMSLAWSRRARLIRMACPGRSAPLREPARDCC